MTWNRIVSGDFRDLGLLIVRLGLGPAFIVHGWDKIANIGVENFAGMLGMFGGAALAVAWLVTLIELLGGFAILLGFGARIAGVLIALVMTAAMFMVKFNAGFLGGWELDFAFFTMGLLMFFAGPGKYSLEKYVNVKA